MLSGAGHRRHRGAWILVSSGLVSESEVGVGEVKIRKSTERDVEALANLMTELGYPSTVEEMRRRLARIYADPSYATLVAERDGLVVGMARIHLERTYEADGEVARIMAFVVGAEKRGQGVGRTLISAAEDWARQREAAEIMLTTHERRAGAHEFYRRMGYDRTGYRFYKEL
jgi:GNAT superfamily N-acetyltransferase